MRLHFVKNIVRTLIVIIAILVTGTPLSAQSVDKSNDDEYGILKKESLSFGGRLNTNGWSLFATYGKAAGFDKSKFYQFELIEFKHYQENKVSNDRALPVRQNFGNNPKSYIYGKQNTFLSMHFSFGKRRLIGEKAEKSGVSAEFVYQYGPSLGLLKPYYLDLIYIVSGDGQPYADPRPKKYSPETREKFLTRTYIYGSSGFSKGLDEISLIPGAHGKAGFHFDWAPYNDVVRALEVGVAADLYIRDVPIMVNERNNFYFLYLYLGIEFGKRW